MAKENKKTVEELDKTRTRNFCGLFYPDCEEHANALDEILKNEDKYLLCYILHNRDTYEEDSENHKAGDTKKEHFHLVIELQNPTTRTALSKKLNINKEALEPCESLKASKRYLLHLDNENKALYELCEVLGNNRDSVVKLVEVKINENISAKIIIDFIDSFDGFLTISDLTRFCASNQLWSVLRRASYIFNNHRLEHNENYKKINKIEN